MRPDSSGTFWGSLLSPAGDNTGPTFCVKCKTDNFLPLSIKNRSPDTTVNYFVPTPGFGDHVFQQVVRISMGKNCAPLSSKLFLYSSMAEFIQQLLQ
jgi:hypothetical protein